VVGTDATIRVYRRALDTGAGYRVRWAEAEVLKTQHERTVKMESETRSRDCAGAGCQIVMRHKGC